MNVNLYIHSSTPAAQISSPVYAECDDKWFIVNGHQISPIAAPKSQSLTPINEQLMRTAGEIKVAVSRMAEAVRV